MSELVSGKLRPEIKCHLWTYAVQSSGAETTRDQKEYPEPVIGPV